MIILHAIGTLHEKIVEFFLHAPYPPLPDLPAEVMAAKGSSILNQAGGMTSYHNQETPSDRILHKPIRGTSRQA